MVDYSKSINEERLYIFDMKERKIILRSKVGHAYKSGRYYPVRFSNKISSKLSSLGAYETLETYYGQWGYSLKIKGLDEELNSNAERRSIVFHPVILNNNYLTEGCFSLPKEQNNKIINLIKSGCLVYVYD